MPVFACKILNADGRTSTEKLRRNDLTALNSEIRKLGGVILKAKELETDKGHRKVDSVPIRELIELNEQLAMLFESGVPLPQGLSDMGDEAEHETIKNIISQLYASVCQGQKFSVALAQFPTVFDDSYRAVIAAGEESGDLAPSLRRLAEDMAWRQEIRQRVRNALIYPCFLLFAVGVLSTLIVNYLIPRLSSVFLNAGVELPKLTQIMLAISDLSRNNWPYLLGGPLFLVVGYLLIRQSASARIWIDRNKLKIPLFGKVIEMSAAALFCRQLEILITSGVSMVRALELSKLTAKNQAVFAALDQVQSRVLQGHRLADSLRETALFPGLVLRMISVGEQAGLMDDALSKVTNFYDKEVPRRVDGFLKKAEPIITMVMGVVVALAVFSAFLPMMKMLTAFRK